MSIARAGAPSALPTLKGAAKRKYRPPASAVGSPCCWLSAGSRLPRRLWAVAELAWSPARCSSYNGGRLVCQEELAAVGDATVRLGWAAASRSPALSSRAVGVQSAPRGTAEIPTEKSLREYLVSAVCQAPTARDNLLCW